VILRSETEWVEIVEEGNGLIVDADRKAITDAYQYFHSKKGQLTFPPIYGNGKAAEFICQTMLNTVS
jgi:UDP-GlcNAc3NAcA epimerase